CARNFGAYW
nr:immunoglobulin heavy chain junction region [Mus musculus]